MIILFVLLSSVSLVVAVCPEGYAYHLQTRKCYKVFEDPLTYFGTVEVCRDAGATLVSIHNASENDYIASNTYSPFPTDAPRKNLSVTEPGSVLTWSRDGDAPPNLNPWNIHLTKNDQREHWIGLTKLINGAVYSWLDKTSFNYLNGDAEKSTERHCVLMKNGTGTWETQTCRYFLPFVCQYDPAVEPSPCPTVSTCPACPTPKPKTKCDEGWKYFDNTDLCYFLGKSEGVNNTEAQNLCKNQGAHLASIHCEAENSFLVNSSYASRRPASAWIGVYRTGPNATNFANYDGTPLDYTNWSEIRTQPDNHGNQEHCVMIYIYSTVFANGEWNDRSCNVYPHAYICKKKANQV